jgi:hypothetical protein
MTTSSRALRRTCFQNSAHAIAETEPPELLAVLRKVEKRNALEIAKRLRTVGQIFRYGIVTGRANRDPSVDLKGALKASGRQASQGHGARGLAMLFAMYRMGFHGRATVHGFRAVASTLLNEMGFHPDWIERQLAHDERNKVRAAYNHAEYLPERRRMMQQWADYLDTLKAGAEVIPLHCAE